MSHLLMLFVKSLLVLLQHPFSGYSDIYPQPQDHINKVWQHSVLQQGKQWDLYQILDFTDTNCRGQTFQLFSRVSVTNKIVVIKLKPAVNFIKLFSLLLTLQANKLESINPLKSQFPLWKAPSLTQKYQTRLFVCPWQTFMPQSNVYE